MFKNIQLIISLLINYSPINNMKAYGNNKKISANNQNYNKKS